MEATYFGNFHLNTLMFKHPYVGIIQIRFMGRRPYLPLSLSERYALKPPAVES
jgi:hypothetical protein